MYQEIFKQGKIGNITPKNRLVMSPMGTSLAEMDGSPSEDMIAFYEHVQLVAQRLLFRRLQG